MSTKHETLAEFVTRIMLEKRFSFRKVSEQSGGGISHSTVADIANGQRFDVKKDTLIALAKGLQVPANDIFRVARGLGTNSLPDRYVKAWTERNGTMEGRLGSNIPAAPARMVAAHTGVQNDV